MKTFKINLYTVEEAFFNTLKTDYINDLQAITVLKNIRHIDIDDQEDFMYDFLINLKDQLYKPATEEMQEVFDIHCECWFYCTEDY